MLFKSPIPGVDDEEHIEDLDVNKNESTEDECTVHRNYTAKGYCGRVQSSNDQKAVSEGRCLGALSV